MPAAASNLRLLTMLAEMTSAGHAPPVPSAAAAVQQARDAGYGPMAAQQRSTRRSPAAYAGSGLAKRPRCRSIITFRTLRMALPPV